MVTLNIVLTLSFPLPVSQCMQAPELFDILGANTTVGLEEQEFQKASVILLYHLENAICKTPDEIARTYVYVDYLYDLVTTTQLDVTQTEIGRFGQYGRGNIGGMPMGIPHGRTHGGNRGGYKRFRRFGQVRVHHQRPAPIQSIVSLPMDLSFPEEQLDYTLHLISQTYKASTQYKVTS